MEMNKIKELELVASHVRRTLFQVVQISGSGHLGGCSSSVELMVALYFGGFLKYDPLDPRHQYRDRVAVRGHLGPLRYSIFNLLGWVRDEELKTYRRLGSRLQGHESMDILPGVDITPSGMLGMVLSYGVGAAIAMAKQDSSATIWIFLGDGEEQEGNVAEAARHAANIGLTNLVCILDRNGKQLSQPTGDIDGASDVRKIWEGYGWQVDEIEDGNSMLQVVEALKRPRSSVRPTFVIANTIKGLGVRGARENPCGYHTISSCPEGALEEAIEGMPVIPMHQLKSVISDLLSEIQKPREYVSEMYEVPKIHLASTSVPEVGLIEYLGRMVEAAKDNSRFRLYVLTADVTVKSLASASGFYQPHVTYIDPGIREQHLLGVAHGISVCDPNSLIFVMENDAFLFRAADQLNAICQAGSKMIIFGNDSGLCSATNGPTHQTVGQPGALANMCGLTLLEPADVVDLEMCLNWAVNHNGPVYIRFHDATVLPIQVSTENRNIVAYVAYDTADPPRMVLVASGIPVGESIKLAYVKQKEGVGIRVVNVISMEALGYDFASMMEEGVPVLTVYNGNPDVLQSAVAKALMENTCPRPSVVLGHGFRLGTSGRFDELMSHFHLDAHGIDLEIRSRFAGIY